MSTATATHNGPAGEVARAGRERVRPGRVEHFDAGGACGEGKGGARRGPALVARAVGAGAGSA